MANAILGAVLLTVPRDLYLFYILQQTHCLEAFTPNFTIHTFLRRSDSQDVGQTTNAENRANTGNTLSQGLAEKRVAEFNYVSSEESTGLSVVGLVLRAILDI